jgi:hypothetical protein
MYIILDKDYKVATGTPYKEISKIYKNYKISVDIKPFHDKVENKELVGFEEKRLVYYFRQGFMKLFSIFLYHFLVRMRSRYSF